MTDLNNLPITQQLILDVLAARHRLGEPVWTFPATASPALRSLENLGLIHIMNGIAARTRRARLSDAGKRLTLDSRYQPPNGGIGRLRDTLTDIAEFAEARTDRIVGMDTVAAHARKALESGPA